MNVWVEFWFGFDPLPTDAWPLALPTFCVALMVVVMSLPVPEALLPRFWISTPLTAPLLTTLLLLSPRLTTPRFWPPTLMPASAHCPLWVIPVVWAPELAVLDPFASPVLVAFPAVLVWV